MSSFPDSLNLSLASLDSDSNILKYYGGCTLTQETFNRMTINISLSAPADGYSMPVSNSNHTTLDLLEEQDDNYEEKFTNFTRF